MSTVSILENQDGSGGEVTFWLSTWMDVVIGLPSLPPVGTYSLRDGLAGRYQEQRWQLSARASRGEPADNR
jgi:hypothetical protein